MAKSGSWQFSTSNSDVKGRVRWSESDVSVSANTSKVTAYVDYYRDDSITTYGTASGTLTVNGKSTSLSKYVELTSSKGWVNIGSYAQTVSHNSDGTKDCSIKWSGGLSGTSAGTQSTSKTVTLTTIDRASVPSVSGDIKIGTAFTVKTNRKNSGFTHTVKIWWGYAAQNNYHEQIKTGVGDSAAFTCGEEWADYLPSSASGTLGIGCTTYNGSTQIGYETITKTMSLPDSWKPTIGSLTLETVNPYKGALLTGTSSVKATATGAVATHSATIKSYTFSGPQLSKTTSDASATSGVINQSGTLTYTVTVSDSRSLTASKSATITATAYKAPTVTISAERCNSSGEADAGGSYCHATIRGEITSLTDNTATASFKIRETGASEWTDAGSITGIAAGSYSQTSAPIAADNAKTYELMVTVADEAGGSGSATAAIPVGYMTVDYLKGGKGVTFFGTATKEGLWSMKGYNGLRFYAGTKIVNPGGKDTVAIITSANVNSNLGVTNSSNTNTFVGMANGDGSANGVHVQGAKYLSGTWYALLASKISSGIRVNYFVVYWG